MPTLLLLIISVLFLTCAPGIAQAESTTEYRAQQGLFLYEDFRHWLTVGYDFQDRASRLNTSSSHALKESYNAALQVALFDPHVFDASLQGSIYFDQNRSNSGGTSSSSSSSSNNATYQYSFTGIGLDKSRIPFSMLSFRSIDTVQNTFTTPTSNDINGNDFEISYLNSRLQSNFHFSRNSSDSTTGGTTSSSLSNSYSYAAAHDCGAYCKSTLNTSFFDQTGSSTSGSNLSSTANSLALTNSLNLGAEHNYTLLSSFSMDNATTDNLPQQSFAFGESLGAALGRVLTIDATYTLTNVRNTSRNTLLSQDNALFTQENTLNQGEVRVKHKLFDSLRTDLLGRVSLNTLSDGTDNSYEASGSLKYLKNLPAGSQLGLGISEGYTLVDRNVLSGNTEVNNELHAAAHQGDVIKLSLGDGTLLNVASVKSRNPVFTYVEGVDYTVNYTLGRITILSGGGVRIDMDGNGTDLYLSYTVYKDPKLKYSTNRLSLTSDVTLFNKQVSFGAAWSEDKPALINGPATNSLQSSRSMLLYAGGIYDNYDYRLSYQNAVSGNLSYQTYEVNGSARRETSESLLYLVLRNNFNKYEGTSTSVAYRENTTDLTVSYVRNILTYAKLTLRATANDMRSDLQPAKDSLSLMANCLIIINMITINLNGQAAWIFDTNGTTRNDTFHIDITRYFD